MRTRLLWAVLAAVLVASMIVSLAVSGLGLAQAQEGADPLLATVTAQPSPTNNGGSATWTVENYTFTSQYPKGFVFSIEATSSAGKLETATVFWRHSPQGSRRRAIATIAEDGKTATGGLTQGAVYNVPQWAGVEYWWEFTDSAGNLFQTPRQFTEYADETRRWSRMESEDIIVFWEEGVPDEVGQLTIDAMRENRELYRRAWPKPLGYKPRAMIYNTAQTYAEWAPGIGTIASSGGATTTVGGQTNETWGATANIYAPFASLGVPGNALEVSYSTVVHEVAHLYQAINGGLRGAPTWFFEGNATYFEIVGRERMLNRVRELAQNGTLPSLQGDGPSARGAFARDAYDIGFAFFVWLEETFGTDAHYRLFELIEAGRPWNMALQQITNLSFVDAETQFRTWLGAINAVAPTPIPSPTLFFFPSPTYEPTPSR